MIVRGKAGVVQGGSRGQHANAANQFGIVFVTANLPCSAIGCPW